MKVGIKRCGKEVICKESDKAQQVPLPTIRLLVVWEEEGESGHDECAQERNFHWPI